VKVLMSLFIDSLYVLQRHGFKEFFKRALHYFPKKLSNQFRVLYQVVSLKCGKNKVHLILQNDFNPTKKNLASSVKFTSDIDQLSTYLHDKKTQILESIQPVNKSNG